MRVLITGCLGYVGGPVIEAVRRSGLATFVEGLDTGYFAAQHEGEGPAPEVSLDRVTFVDVRDVGPELLVGVDAVIHLAAISNDPMGDRFARPTEEVNLTASIGLAALAKAAGCKSFTFASSASVYGVGGSYPRKESSDLAPQTVYATTKIATERALSEMADRDFQVSCLRFSTACGWSSRVRLDLVLNDFVASALTVGRIEVLSDGTPWRPLINVSDMARAIVWTLGEERADLGNLVIANVGADDWNFQIRDLAAAVAEELGDVEVSVTRDAAPDTRSYRLDFEHWRQIATSGQPASDLATTIKELATQLRAAVGLGADFRTSDRVRLHRLEKLRREGYLDASLRWRLA